MKCVYCLFRLVLSLKLSISNSSWKYTMFQVTNFIIKFWNSLTYPGLSTTLTRIKVQLGSNNDVQFQTNTKKYLWIRGEKNDENLEAPIEYTHYETTFENSPVKILLVIVCFTAEAESSKTSTIHARFHLKCWNSFMFPYFSNLPFPPNFVT